MPNTHTLVYLKVATLFHAKEVFSSKPPNVPPFSKSKKWKREKKKKGGQGWVVVGRWGLKLIAIFW